MSAEPRDHWFCSQNASEPVTPQATHHAPKETGRPTTSLQQSPSRAKHAATQRESTNTCTSVPKPTTYPTVSVSFRPSGPSQFAKFQQSHRSEIEPRQGTPPSANRLSTSAIASARFLCSSRFESSPPCNRSSTNRLRVARSSSRASASKCVVASLASLKTRCCVYQSPASRASAEPAHTALVIC